MAVLSASGTAFAQQVEFPQPLQELVRTEVVYPQEKREVQLTAGSLFDQGLHYLSPNPLGSA